MPSQYQERSTQDAHLHPASRRTTPLSTQNINPESRFSFASDTPDQVQRDVYHQFSSPANSVIDESPMSATPRQQMSFESAPGPRFPYLEDRKVPEEPAPQYSIDRHQVHPAHFAPYAEPDPDPSSLTQQYSLAPTRPVIQVPSIPQPHSPYHVQKEDPFAKHFPAPDPSDVPKTPRTPTYNPHSLAGPNGAPETNHIPGQVSHPNSSINPSWGSGLCSIDSTCCIGLACPCILYGKTQYRLSQKIQKKEATDLLGYSSMNHSCATMALGFCFSGILAAIQRTRVRKLYHIAGSVVDDCVKGCCCCCCVLAQDEREVERREERARRFAGPASYTSPPGMTYPPPPTR